MFHWRLETKYVRAYVEYGINNQGNADTRNTEYWGEACKIYFAKLPEVDQASKIDLFLWTKPYHEKEKIRSL